MLGAAAPDAAAAEAPVLGAAAPDAGAAKATATSATAASTTATEAPTPVPEALTSSSNPVADEELEVVFGRQLLQGPTEEEATLLPRVLVQVRESIMEATSSAEAAFRREWAALESERQRLSDWHTCLEAQTKAEASHAVDARLKLKADQEAYRANLRKVFDREFIVSNREKTVARREETFALEVVSFAAQRSELETRLAAQQSELEAHSQSLEVRR